jgi:hypothetical protein
MVPALGRIVEYGVARSKTVRLADDSVERQVRQGVTIKQFVERINIGLVMLAMMQR